MTAEEFTSNETNRDELARILASPVFQQASELALANMVPGLNNEGLANPHVGNGYLQQIVGGRTFLHELTKFTSTKKVEAPQARRLYTEDDLSLLKQRAKEQE